MSNLDGAKAFLEKALYRGHLVLNNKTYSLEKEFLKYREERKEREREKKRHGKRSEAVTPQSPPSVMHFPHQGHNP